MKHTTAIVLILIWICIIPFGCTFTELEAPEYKWPLRFAHLVIEVFLFAALAGAILEWREKN